MLTNTITHRTVAAVAARRIEETSCQLLGFRLGSTTGLFGMTMKTIHTLLIAIVMLMVEASAGRPRGKHRPNLLTTVDSSRNDRLDRQAEGCLAWMKRFDIRENGPCGLRHR